MLGSNPHNRCHNCSHGEDENQPDWRQAQVDAQQKKSGAASGIDVIIALLRGCVEAGKDKRIADGGGQQAEHSQHDRPAPDQNASMLQAASKKATSVCEASKKVIFRLRSIVCAVALAPYSSNRMGPSVRSSHSLTCL